MTKEQLNKEYAEVLIEAEKANGRKESVSLLHKANRIRAALAQNNFSQ